MSEEKILTKEIAEQLLKDDSIDLSVFTKIEVAAAQLLPNNDSFLNYDGELQLELTELTEGVAEILSKHQGGIAFSGLKQLSPNVARKLFIHNGGLKLYGLKVLCDEVAGILSRYQGALELGGLTELSDTAAESLAKYQGRSLYLGGLTELSDAAAENLSKYKGRLYLNGLSEISDSAAYSLSKQSDLVLGDPVFSDTAREILSETVGYIHMKKKTITRVIAERFLLRWNKERLMEKLPRVYLDEFSLLNDDAAHKLSEAEVGLNLSGLIHLSDSSAEILSKHRGKSTLGGGLNLDGISELTETATDHLCEYKGYLKIGKNLQKINERLAARLINQKDMSVNGRIYDLHFPFLTELGETVAETLSKHQADIRLPYDLQSKLDAYKKN